MYQAEVLSDVSMGLTNSIRFTLFLVLKNSLTAFFASQAKADSMLTVP